MRKFTKFFEKIMSPDFVNISKIIFLSFLIYQTLFNSPFANSQARIKDIANFEGVRENMLVGYGLVVGLSGTGDRLENSVFTRESLVGVLERLGVNANDDRLRTTNVAAVIVTAILPAFSRHGSKIDINVSALGDAESLQGGTLLATPLVAADGQVYAVGQGTVSISSLVTPRGGLGNPDATRGVPTSARITSGAIVENEINFDLNNKRDINLALNNPDFTTARRVSLAINSFVGANIATTTDPGTVAIQIPPVYRESIVSLIADIEQLRVTVDQPARVVVNEHAGIIVMGNRVRIGSVAISQGNLVVQVNDQAADAQNNAPESQAGQFRIADTGTTLRQLVDGLNSLGVGPRDMIEILQAIHVSGALQAKLEIM